MKHLLETIVDVLTSNYGVRIVNRVSRALRDGITMGTFKSRGTWYVWALQGSTFVVEREIKD
jgi:hypothetical protein